MIVSIPVANSMEYIQNTEVSPLVGKGYCKVCYVGQDANRNGTVITKEVATEFGRKILGSPVVGFFNKDAKDFEGHNRELIVRDGEFEFVDVTRPYGFVPTNADVWFEKFDDNGVIHEYLCCTVYIWTGAYPESQRILEQGNNQSMELTKGKGFWTNNNKTNARIFIYNEALIEKLCVLGENVEPCFEGAQIGKERFSLESSPEFQEFKATMYSMINELQETLSKGGSQGTMEVVLEPEVVVEQEVIEEEPVMAEEVFEEKPEEEEEKPTEEEKEEKEPEEEEKKYNLDEVVEYAELKTQYDELEAKYSALESDKAALEAEVASLKEFKLAADRQSKQSMIDSFYMLSDEDKKDVIENIDTYSIDDIEAKLSIICVRNKVNFSLDDVEEKPATIFNLDTIVERDNAPDWVRAVRANQND